MDMLESIGEGMRSIGRSISQASTDVKNYVESKFAKSADNRMDSTLKSPEKGEKGEKGHATGTVFSENVAAPLKEKAPVVSLTDRLFNKQGKLEEKARIYRQAVPELQKEVNKLGTEITELEEKIQVLENEIKSETKNNVIQAKVDQQQVLYGQLEVGGDTPFSDFDQLFTLGHEIDTLVAERDTQRKELARLKGELGAKQLSFDVKKGAIAIADKFVDKHPGKEAGLLREKERLEAAIGLLEDWKSEKLKNQADVSKNITNQKDENLVPELIKAFNMHVKDLEKINAKLDSYEKKLKAIDAKLTGGEGEEVSNEAKNSVQPELTLSQKGDNIIAIDTQGIKESATLGNKPLPTIPYAKNKREINESEESEDISKSVNENYDLESLERDLDDQLKNIGNSKATDASKQQVFPEDSSLESQFKNEQLTTKKIENDELGILESELDNIIKENKLNQLIGSIKTLTPKAKRAEPEVNPSVRELAAAENSDTEKEYERLIALHHLETENVDLNIELQEIEKRIVGGDEDVLKLEERKFEITRKILQNSKEISDGIA